MRQFFSLVVLVFFAMPFGLSVVGCSHKAVAQYCSGNLESGPQVGQVQTITLAASLAVTGESLNYGQIGSTLNATAADCNGGAVTVSGYTFNSTDRTIADVNPTTGTVCGGTWNRNSGGGVNDYTICTPPPASNTKHVAFITASASGATSNPIAIYIHAPVTNVQLGIKTDCNTDPSSDCTTTANGQACNPSTIGNTVTQPGYDAKSCISQGSTRQLAARVYDAAGNNITCQVGPVAFALQGSASSIASISAQGFVTANQPGSALVTATVSNSSSAVNSGFFSTCPPAHITLTPVNQSSANGPIKVALNSAQSFTATVTDTLGAPITNITLEFNSTLPVNFPTSGSSVTPAFPGTATITAVCNPGACNPAPFSQIGLFGNGNPITSNGITVTAAGTSASVLYMASTPSTTTVNGQTTTNSGSQYIVSEDFTTGQLGTPIKLPYVPNSMVISQDGSTLYVGSQQGLTTVTTSGNAVGSTYPAVQGTVLAVAPNNSFVVITDPSRQTVSLVSPTGTISSSYNGVGTRAAWTPDSSTLYVVASTNGPNTPANVLLTYTTFRGWESTSLDGDEPYTDVAVTVPAVGAYFAGARTEGRSYCASTTLTGTTTPQTALNVFSPIADVKAVPTDRLAATTDGQHILGATATGPALQDLAVTLPVQGNCPIPPATVPNNYFTSAPTTHALSGIAAAAITGVVPSSNSSAAFITYTGTGSVLPLYQPGTGVVTNIPLSAGALAPVAGVFSSDDTTFYAGTSGDNQVHIISVNGPGSKDTGVIAPNLQAPNGGTATPNLIAQRVRRTTS